MNPRIYAFCGYYIKCISDTIDYACPYCEGFFSIGDQLPTTNFVIQAIVDEDGCQLNAPVKIERARIELLNKPFTNTVSASSLLYFLKKNPINKTFSHGTASSIVEVIL